MRGQLVGPLPTIRFRDGTTIAYDVPRDTLDNRYAACSDHRPACDCREAHLSEDINEYRENLRAVELAAREVLKGHRVHSFSYSYDYRTGAYNPDDAAVCLCTGCQIARKGYLSTLSFP